MKKISLSLFLLLISGFVQQLSAQIINDNLAKKILETVEKGKGNPFGLSSYQEWIIVGSCWILTTAIIIFILFRFCIKEFLNSFLVEKNCDPKKMPGGTKESPKVQAQSASRLILFLSGLATVLISLLVVPYWLTTYIKYGVAIELSPLLSFLLPLGIGVIPYSFNQAFKK
ncbi:MAG: hypothetical protein JKY48_13465 [Flavobacteriales bacterium]|nr:hypothetical protein [Flavobacteriales bacterium]